MISKQIKKICLQEIFPPKILWQNIFPKKGGKAALLPAGPRLISSDSEISA